MLGMSISSTVKWISQWPWEYPGQFIKFTRYSVSVVMYKSLILCSSSRVEFEVVSIEMKHRVATLRKIEQSQILPNFMRPHYQPPRRRRNRHFPDLHVWFDCSNPFNRPHSGKKSPADRSGIRRQTRRPSIACRGYLLNLPSSSESGL